MKTRGRKTAKPNRRKQATVRRGHASPSISFKEQLDQRTLELAEALERQAATDDVLRVIASSSGDLQPVFDAILSNATRLCGAMFGVLFRSERDALCAVVFFDTPSAISII
jgi:hypothetical protein